MTLRKLPQQIVKNSKGEVIRLSAQEKAHAAWMQRQINERFENALGYEISITTLTEIVKEVTEQKFYTTAPAKFVPIKVGRGAWMSNLTTYRSYDIGDEFETGIINLGGDSTRLATADAGVDALNIKIFNWAKSVGWNIFQLEEAAKSGNWDLVAAKERARKKNWDLGVQRVAFLGSRGQNAQGSGTCYGLLNQPGVVVDTVNLTKPINTMSTTELKTWCALVVELFRANCNRTAYPSHFAIPESDYNGLATQASPSFPIKSTLQLIAETFKTICQNDGFQIQPLAYSDAAYHADCPTIAGKQVYTLYNYDSESVRMDIPLDYTNTLANSLDNFNFQNAAYGQFTGVQTYRPLEMYYFQF